MHVDQTLFVQWQLHVGGNFSHAWALGIYDAVLTVVKVGTEAKDDSSA